MHLDPAWKSTKWEAEAITTKLQSPCFPHYIILPSLLPSKSPITMTVIKITDAKHYSRSSSTVPGLEEFLSGGIKQTQRQIQLKLMLQSQLLSIP